MNGGVLLEKLVSKGIMAILPVYIGDSGNCTYAYTKSGVVELSFTIKTVIKNLCEYYYLDLKSCNKTYGGLLSSKYRPPIPFNRDNIFIQFKTRVPIGKHDGAYGYFNINSIKGVKGLEKNTIISLIDDQEIEVLSSKYTVEKYINNGEIVRKLIKDNKYIYPKDASNLYDEENTPATKSDIALLYLKMLEIKERLE